MGERELIIADRDAEYCDRMADFFRDEGFHVGTADTPEEAVAQVRENQAAVLLLDSGFGGTVSTSDLIHQLKKSSRHLHIIMVSEEMSLTQARQARQDGIFYHALKPATSLDTEELWQAVACAFERHRACVLADPAKSLQGQPGDPGDKGGAGRRLPAKGITGILGVVAALLGASYYFLAAQPPRGGGNLGTWIFLGFLALVVVGQVLPIFRIKPASDPISSPHAAHRITDNAPGQLIPPGARASISFQGGNQ